MEEAERLRRRRLRGNGLIAAIGSVTVVAGGVIGRYGVETSSVFYVWHGGFVAGFGIFTTALGLGRSVREIRGLVGAHPDEVSETPTQSSVDLLPPGVSVEITNQEVLPPSSATEGSE